MRPDYTNTVRMHNQHRSAINNKTCTVFAFVRGAGLCFDRQTISSDFPACRNPMCHSTHCAVCAEQIGWIVQLDHSLATWQKEGCVMRSDILFSVLYSRSYCKSKVNTNVTHKTQSIVLFAKYVILSSSL